MNNNELKLSCPMCDKEFVTKRRDQVWCSRKCSRKYSNIKHLIKANYSKQENMKNTEVYSYDFNKDKFFLKIKL